MCVGVIVCTYMCVHAYTHQRHVCECVYMLILMCVSVGVYGCNIVYIYVCVCVFVRVCVRGACVCAYCVHICV